MAHSDGPDKDLQPTLIARKKKIEDFEIFKEQNLNNLSPD